jgi:hypothetical protein
MSGRRVSSHLDDMFRLGHNTWLRPRRVECLRFPAGSDLMTSPYTLARSTSLRLRRNRREVKVPMRSARVMPLVVEVEVQVEAFGAGQLPPGRADPDRGKLGGDGHAVHGTELSEV